MSKKEQKQPRSVRLNKSHRADMVHAVIAEWEAQNPAPAPADHYAFMELVAKQVKKSNAYKRTERLMNGARPDDMDHVKVEDDVQIHLVNGTGEHMGTATTCIPISVAEKVGLVYARETTRGTLWATRRGMSIEDFNHEDLTTLPDQGPDPVVRVAAWVEKGGYVVVTLDRDAKPYKRMEAAKRERERWEEEREQLRRETADLLENFTSTKQLREGWPDIVPYLPPHVADPEQAVRLPVRTTDRLSERLGIKKEGK